MEEGRALPEPGETVPPRPPPTARQRGPGAEEEGVATSAKGNPTLQVGTEETALLGQLPVLVTLVRTGGAERESPESPPPSSFPLMMHRCAYLHTYALSILEACWEGYEHEVAHLPEASLDACSALLERVWFTLAPAPGGGSAAGQPLKWQWPVGVLYDLHAGADPTDMSGRLPWRICLHLGPPTAYPTAILLPFSPDLLRGHFQHALKEADYCRHGNVSKTMELPRQTTLDLWAWMSRPVTWSPSSLALVRQVRRDLGMWEAAAAAHPTTTSATATGMACKVHAGGRVHQYKWPSSTTVGQLVDQLLPPTPTRDAPATPSPYHCWVQGVCVPHECTLHQLLPLCYCDTYLYLVLASRPAPEPES